MQDFLISVASGLAVAILSAWLLGDRRKGHGSMPTQSMSMTTNTAGRGSSVFLAFAVGIATAGALLLYFGRL